MWQHHFSQAELAASKIATPGHFSFKKSETTTSLICSQCHSDSNYQGRNCKLFTAFVIKRMTFMLITMAKLLLCPAPIMY